jgi:hypothetical protein
VSDFLRETAVKADRVVPFETLASAVFDGEQMLGLIVQQLPVDRPRECVAVLELGCGCGMLSALLHRHGFHVTSVDALPHALWPVLTSGVGLEPIVLELDAREPLTHAFLSQWAQQHADRTRICVGVRVCELLAQVPALARAANCSLTILVPCSDSESEALQRGCRGCGCTAAADWTERAAEVFDSMRRIQTDKCEAWLLTR